MSDNHNEWIVSISRVSKTSDTLQLSIPAAIGRSLTDKGMWRAKITITPEGILVRPYVADPVGRGSPKVRAVELPDWGTP